MESLELRRNHVKRPKIPKDSKEDVKDIESSSKSWLSKGGGNEANRGLLFGGSTKEPMGVFRNALDYSSKDKET